MADEPLLELEESWVFGMLWPKRLLIFEDRIETRGYELLRETVETTRYREVKGVTVGGAGWSTTLLIKRSGSPMLFRGVEESAARYAKSLIEDRTSRPAEGRPNEPDLIRKLADLRNAGILSPEEFEAKRRAIEERDR